MRFLERGIKALQKRLFPPLTEEQIAILKRVKFPCC